MLYSRRQSLLLFAAAIGSHSLGFSASVLAQIPPRKGGTLTFVEQGEPTTLVPLLDSNTRTRTISTKVIEGLLSFDPQFRPQPKLATAWDISEDGLRYRFALRRGVKWHDGRDFTSADVRFSLLALKKVGPRGRITFANLEAVETPDPHTAIVVLSKPTPYLLKALTGGESPILPEHAYPQANLADSPNGNAPIGTGPFVFVEWKQGSHVLLRRNPDYWQPDAPHLDRIVIRFVSDAAAASAALETGEADLSLSVALPDLERLQGNARMRIETFSDAYMNNAQILEFNLDHPTVAKTEVRHALAHAIDRKFINDVIFYGHAHAAASTIPAALAAYNDETPFNYPFDLSEANRLLDAAGLKSGSDGTRFSLRLAFLPSALFKQTAEYLRGAFAKVGVKIEILDGDLGTYLKRVYNERGFELNLNGISRLFDPTAGVQRLYWSDGIKNPLPYLNAAHYNNPEVDQLFRRAAVELDEVERTRQFKEIQRITGAELPAIAVVALPTIIVSNTRARNYVTTVDVASSDFAQAWVAD
jgi:peptide/nickel transport system substrate-binding protein